MHLPSPTPLLAVSAMLFHGTGASFVSRQPLRFNRRLRGSDAPYLGTIPVVAAVACNVVPAATTAASFLSSLGLVSVSTATGMAASRCRSRALGGLGPTISLLLAAALSSLRVDIPGSNLLYDLCWSRLLPMSLALLVISPYTGAGGSSNTLDNLEKYRREFLSDDGDEDDGGREEIMALSVPFSAGCLGSVLGCATSFLVNILGANNSNRVHHRIFSGRAHYFWIPGHLLLEPAEAAVAAGCLCASYVGGSANFFATARVVTGVKFPKGNDGTVGMLGSLVGSSASDLILMVLYLSTVTASLSTAVLKSWFPGRNIILLNKYGATSDDSDMSEGMVSIQKRADGNNLSEDDENNAVLSNKLTGSGRILINVMGRRVLLTLLIAILAWLIVEIAETMEARVFNVPTPGIGCVIIVCLGTLISRILKKMTAVVISRFSVGDIQGGMNVAQIPKKSLLEEMETISSDLSDACFHALFAAIGSKASLGEAFLRGGWHSASGFLFASLALVIHIITIVLGSLFAEKLFPQLRFFPLGIEEIAIASSALIGGPVTASAFAAGISATGHRSTVNRHRALIRAAIFWGVVGYAIATGLGVGLTRFLLMFVPAPT